LIEALVALAIVAMSLTAIGSTLATNIRGTQMGRSTSRIRPSVNG
jgi:type II secretory pathway pseudopilin PulG